MDPQALDLATKTLAAAIDSLMSKGSPVAPLVFVATGGAVEPRRVAAARGEEPAAVAKQMASDQEGADATAYAVDGVITYNGARTNGLIVEAWNFAARRGARIGLRYELKGAMRRKPSLLGSPLHLGRSGWYDPEDGEPAEVPTFPEVARSAPPATPAPAALPAPFGPPPDAAALARADIAPPPPPSAAPAPAALATEPPALPRVFSAPVAEPPAAPPVAPSAPVPEPSAPMPQFGPPPTTAPVQGFPPPASALPAAPEPPIAMPPVVRPVIDTAPPTAAHPVEAPAPSGGAPAELPSYVPVPLQRNETPLGNRAMFAGIMELATKGRSFPAFAIVQKGGAWEQVTMTDASLEDAAASVRAYARSRTDAEFIAFAVDGSVPVGDTTADAVIVEVWEYATRVSFSVAQRYIPTGEPPSPRLSGRPLMRTQAGWVDVPSSMMLGGQVQFGYRDPDAP